MNKFLKVIFIFVIAIFCISLVGCTTPEKPDDNKPTQEELRKTVSQKVDNYLKTIIPDCTDKSIELPEECVIEEDKYCYIEWETNHKATISNKGVYKANLFDQEVTLTATVIYDELNEDITLTYNVIAKGREDKEAYKKIIEDRIPDLVFKDIDLVTRDITYKNENIFGYITYTSSNPDVFSNDGKYLNKGKDDVEIVLSYVIQISGIEITGEKNITIEGKKDEYYINESIKWLNQKYENVDKVFSDLSLPATDDNCRVTFTWQSNDLSIISNNGKLVTFSPNKVVKMTATITCNDTTGTWEKEFRTYNDSEMMDFIVERMHRDEVNQYVMKTAFYNKNNLGFLPFYVQDIALKDIVESTDANNTNIKYYTEDSNPNVKNLKVTTGLIPWNNMGRTKIKKTGTYLITVHDTGSTMSAAEWNRLETTNDERQTSWNFTVGDTDIYQHVPLDEVAWHAGDGSTRFGLNDTGVKYQGPDPIITVGADHYLYINGTKSKIMAPIINNSSATEYNGKYATEITPAGIYTCLGKNGNYYMNNIYASNYSQAARRFYISNCGGNRNSIGIETCINKDADYNQVMRNCANLVAHLLMLFGIEPDAVLQHRNFSGKLCPQVMIENDTWDYFKTMVTNEYIILKYMNNIKFEYTSNDLTLLDNNGKILKTVTTPTPVTYKVKVTFNGSSKEFTKTTTINPIVK